MSIPSYKHIPLHTVVSVTRNKLVFKHFSANCTKKFIKIWQEKCNLGLRKLLILLFLGDKVVKLVPLKLEISSLKHFMNVLEPHEIIASF